MGIAEDIKQSKFNSEFHKVMINVIYTNNWVMQEQIRLFKGHNLTMPQFNILRILRGQYPNPATVNLLIERMLDKSSNASRIVDRLEEKGLVVRRQCKNDRRAVDVLISEDGLRLLDVLDKELIMWEKDHEKLNATECAELNRLLDKFRGS